MTDTNVFNRVSQRVWLVTSVCGISLIEIQGVYGGDAPIDLYMQTYLNSLKVQLIMKEERYFLYDSCDNIFTHILVDTEILTERLTSVKVTI